MSIIVIDEQIRIPAWVTDFNSFRRWSRSPQFPERGRLGWLGDRLWIELTMERVVHNQIKSECNRVLGNLVKGEVSRVLAQLTKQEQSGLYLSDGMLLTNVEAKLSTEPDGMYLSYASLRAGRSQLRKGKDSLEVLGTVDMTLEVVSPTSADKDLIELRRLYWLAAVKEYWLIDSRSDHPQLIILRRGRSRYLSTRSDDGWVASAVFEKSFRLTQAAGLAGLPEFTLDVR